jgi:hypothetical protein
VTPNGTGRVSEEDLLAVIGALHVQTVLLRAQVAALAARLAEIEARPPTPAPEPTP